MKIGFAGLGKMGSQIVRKLLAEGHEVVVDSRHKENTDPLLALGAESYKDYDDLLTKLPTPQIIWLMIQHTYVPDEVATLLSKVKPDAIIVDGGNSRFTSTVELAKQAAEKNVSFVDVGTSGGVWGEKHGFSMMVGGPQAAVDEITPLLDIMARPAGAWYRFGESGAGHFVKMVHNGVEYGVMQSMAEGYKLLREGPYKSIDLGKVAEVWQHRSINESFLNGLAERMLKRDPEFPDAGYKVAESGEGRWAAETAEKFGISVPALQAALQFRRQSKHNSGDWAAKFLAQLRNEFGGHDPHHKN